MTTRHDERDDPRAWYREHRAGIIAGLAGPAQSDRRTTALVMLVLDDDPAALVRVDVAHRVAEVA